MNQNKQECYALNSPVQCVCVCVCVRKREREIDLDGDYVDSVIVMQCTVHAQHFTYVYTYMLKHAHKTPFLSSVYQ